MQTQNIPHPRLIFAIEGDEESGSNSYIYFLKKLAPKIGNPPDFLICLDSGAGNYETLWLTTSLRGCCKFHLTVEVLN
jgi:acetylornithine deacetylase/succinyl-diaminopimelate desuccinylase-like protein